jgi:hypothetical protein
MNSRHIRTPVKLSQDIAVRTRWFRSRLEQWRHLWEVSLNKLGTCAYAGVIDPRAITRIAEYPRESSLAYLCDPTISVLNHELLGGQHRATLRWLFDGQIEDVYEMAPHLKLLPPYKQERPQVIAQMAAELRRDLNIRPAP